MVRIVSLHRLPPDPASYDDYYRRVHIPIARRIPGVRKIRFGHVRKMEDGSSPPFHLVSDVYFDDMPSLESALESPEMAAALGDVPNFAAPGAITIMFCETEDVEPEAEVT